MPPLARQTSREFPLVSVVVITFNHERFISQAIDSVLMQELDVTTELVIGDDCSTDRTRDIVREYAQRYPGVISAILPERNLGMGRNFLNTLAKSSGEFVACLDGDDYWTDKGKLARQVAFFLSNPDCSVCHHRVWYVDDATGARLREFPTEDRRVSRVEGDLLALRNFIQTCSLMFRRSALPALDDGFTRLKLGDYPLCALLAEHGLIGYLDANMADYRVHAASSWATKDQAWREAATRDMALFLLRRLKSNSRGRWFAQVIPAPYRKLDDCSQCGTLGATARAAASFVWQGLLTCPREAPLLFSVAFQALVRASGHSRQPTAGRINPPTD